MSGTSGIKIPTESSIVEVPFSVQTADRELRLALNVHKIFKVVDFEVCDPLPDALKPFVGVINVDDMPVPIFDLGLFFNSNASSLPEGTKSAVRSAGQRVVISSFQNVTIGLLVDRTRKLEQYATDKVLPALEIFNHNDHSSFFSAMINEGGHFTYLLDIEGILNKFGLNAEDKSFAETGTGLLAGKKILVVEDAPFFRKRSVQILTKQGATVDTAANGKEGLDKLIANNFAYDLVFTDIEMPIMNGIHMAVEIRRLCSNKKLPILFNSAISNPTLIQELKETGLGEYIVKFDEKTINAKLVEVMSGS